MTNLITAAVVFLLLHLVVSGTRLRDGLVTALGAGSYRGLFSIASLVCLVWLGIAYSAALGFHEGGRVYWTGGHLAKIAQLIIQLIAFVFVVGGLTTRNPTAVGGEGALDSPEPAQGMLRITRHPFLWGVALWAAGHILVSGLTADLILFGTMLVLALVGTVSIDAKRARTMGEAWTAFAAKTSNVPFAAIASGRQRFDLAEIGWVRLGGSLILWLLILGAHPLVFGDYALPN